LQPPSSCAAQVVDLCLEIRQVQLKPLVQLGRIQRTGDPHQQQLAHAAHLSQSRPQHMNYLWRKLQVIEMMLEVSHPPAEFLTPIRFLLPGF